MKIFRKLFVSVIAVVVGMGFVQANNGEEPGVDLEINYELLNEQIFEESPLIRAVSEDAPSGEKSVFINIQGEIVEEVHANKEKDISQTANATPLFRTSEPIARIHGISYYLLEE